MKDSADMTVLVTGASGLLGLNFSLALHNRARIVGVAHHTRLQNTPFSLLEADLTDRRQVDALLEQARPDAILNCAALANLDRCEEDPELAQRMNADLPGWLASWSKRNAAGLVHISTDAVFDGARGEYREDDTPNPLGRYAVTKLEGEQRVLAADPDAAVCRVNFYGCSPSGKRSLVEFFYNHLSESKAVNGFTDVLFCPLYVLDLSEILWK
ncbi:MAG: SDR family oxidoreductase, partial [Anaerolineaceae bacterium]